MQCSMSAESTKSQKVVHIHDACPLHSTVFFSVKGSDSVLLVIFFSPPRTQQLHFFLISPLLSYLLLVVVFFFLEKHVFIIVLHFLMVFCVLNSISTFTLELLLVFWLEVSLILSILFLI